ncbi:MAG: phenyltransferase domain-containing protein [Desulfobacterales bacterium]|jgi:hypothetical protein
MTQHIQISRVQDPLDIESTAEAIAATQSPDGQIPWFLGGKSDPWDMVEAAMGLTVGGYLAHARRAYRWLARQQLPDGSWYAAYDPSNRPLDRTRETHLACYIAVGLDHYHRVSADREFIQELWPTVRRAVAFALAHQTASGEIYWAVSPQGEVDPMALLTGCSSIHKSLQCAENLAQIMGRRCPEWARARRRLARTIATAPQRFNMTKARFSMDWFYPILGGALSGPAAVQRLERGWKKFVIEGQGVRCVSDQPWVTIAETCELVLSLAAMGNQAQARIVFSWISGRRDERGFYWCGYTFPDITIWPTQPTTWTNAAVLLAADALYGLTPAAGLFRHPRKSA